MTTINVVEYTNIVRVPVRIDSDRTAEDYMDGDSFPYQNQADHDDDLEEYADVY